jgi:hypothetical protein
MIDLYNSSQKNNTQFYYSSAIWYKPRGVSNILITAIGGGGGGGGGHSAAAGSAKGGGGGGASGGISRLYLPAIVVPDLLSITVGLGGTGGSATVAGSSGSQTIINITNSVNASQTYFLLANGGGGGGAGTAAARGAGGTAAVISTSAAALFSNLGHQNFVVGMAGVQGGLTTLNSAGVSITYGTAAPYAVITGGAGGGGRSGSGGSISPVAGLGNVDYPTIAGGSSASSPNGVGGYYRIKGFYSIGGGGGVGIDASPGGNGGVGGPGSGGGGGGAGTTGGSGGKGGDGIVIITCW